MNKRATRVKTTGVDESISSALAGFRLDTERSYTAQVHEKLQQAIVRGKLLPNTALSEATIATFLQISRTPVREALAQLADEQLVLIYRQVGTFVAPVNLSLLEEGRFVRSTLECANHVQLVHSISADQIAELALIIEQQRNAVLQGHLEKYSELDEWMHRRLFEFAGREHVWIMLEPFKRQFDRVRWLLLGVPGHADRSLREHELMLDQLAARDVAALSATIASHINHITQHLAELREQAPAEYFYDPSKQAKDNVS